MLYLRKRYAVVYDTHNYTIAFHLRKKNTRSWSRSSEIPRSILRNQRDFSMTFFLYCGLAAVES